MENDELYLKRLEAEKLDALAEFAAGAGHDINNPLAIISGHAQMLLKEIQNEEHRRSLAVIAAQVKRAFEMIADIRLFARPPKPEFKRFDILSLLKEIVEEQRNHVIGTKIEVCGMFEPGSLEIISDPLQLNVVFSAVCKNAREALRENGRIEISLKGLTERVRVSISDDGPGIPEEVRPLIFCPYYSARQAGRGLGFGLSKAWRIVQQCRGTIEVENREPHGVEFTIELPINAETDL